jgi:hypothetical protein
MVLPRPATDPAATETDLCCSHALVSAAAGMQAFYPGNRRRSNGTGRHGSRKAIGPLSSDVRLVADVLDVIDGRVIARPPDPFLELDVIDGRVIARPPDPFLERDRVGVGIVNAATVRNPATYWRLYFLSSSMGNLLRFSRNMRPPKQRSWRHHGTPSCVCSLMIVSGSEVSAGSTSSSSYQNFPLDFTAVDVARPPTPWRSGEVAFDTGVTPLLAGCWVTGATSPSWPASVAKLSSLLASDKAPPGVGPIGRLARWSQPGNA